MKTPQKSIPTYQWRIFAMSQQSKVGSLYRTPFPYHIPSSFFSFFFFPPTTLPPHQNLFILTFTLFFFFSLTAFFFSSLLFFSSLFFFFLLFISLSLSHAEKPSTLPSHFQVEKPPSASMPSTTLKGSKTSIKERGIGVLIPPSFLVSFRHRDTVAMATRNDTRGKPIRCKAAICRKAGEALVIEEVEVDPPKAWEVRIKILCTTLCHSDVTIWKRDSGPNAKFPRIFGHEAVGVVESVGEEVEEVKEGEMVVPVFLSNCGECSDCKSPKSNMCSKFRNDGGGMIDLMPRDGTSRFRDINGEMVYHFLCVSSFSQYTVVDLAHLVKITHHLPLHKACLLSCGVSTGLGAAWKVADVEEGSTVAIFGLGTVGLAVAVAAKQRGASRIIGIDLNDDKFEIGKRFGITDFVNPSTCKDKSVSEVIKEMTNGGADYCFECIGLASLMADAFSSSREGWGKTIILGVEMHGSPVTLSPYDLIKGKSVTGSLFGGIKPKSDIPLFAKTYLDKKLDLEGFVTHEVEFEDINKAFEYLLQGKSLRCIIKMDH